MAYKISGTEVINDSRKGIFTSANVGSFTPSNRPTSGISAGDIIYNSDTKSLEVYDGSSWLGAGGGGGKSPHATGGNVIYTPSGWTHIWYSSGPIIIRGSSTGTMVYTKQHIGGGGGGGGSTGAGGGGAGQYVYRTMDFTSSSYVRHGYVTIGAGGAGGANNVGTDGTYTTDYHPTAPYRAVGAGGGGGGGAPPSPPGRPGTTEPGFSNFSGSGGGGCAYNSGSSGAPGGTGYGAPGGGKYSYTYPGGRGYDQWWAPGNPANWGIGGYYTGAGGGGAGGPGPAPGPGNSRNSVFPGGAGRSIPFGYAHTQWVAWGGGGGCNDVPNNGPANTPSYGGTGAPTTHSRGGVEALRTGPATGRLVMNGQYGTGSGGGGGGQSPATGGSGGSGVFILSYPINYKNYADALNPGIGW